MITISCKDATLIYKICYSNVQIEKGNWKIKKEDLSFFLPSDERQRNSIHLNRETVNLLFRTRGMGRSPGKLLPGAEGRGRGQQYPRASPHTEGLQINCSPRGHVI